MNSQSLRYHVYSSLLEEDLSSSQQDIMLEGIVDKLLAFFGAGKDTAQELGQGAAKIFKNHNFARRLAASTKNINNEISDLKSLAKDAGVGEEVVDNVIAKILSKSGLEGVASSLAHDNSGTRFVSGSGDADRNNETRKNNKTINVNSDDADVKLTPNTLAKATAEVTGKDYNSVVKSIQTQKPDAISVAKVIAVAIADKAGVSKQSAYAVVKALISDGHFTLTESRRRKAGLTLENLRHVINEIQTTITEYQTYSTWNKITEHLINESNKFNLTPEKIIQRIKLMKMEPDDLLSVMKEMDDEWKIQHFDKPDVPEKILKAFKSEGKVTHMNLPAWKDQWEKKYIGSYSRNKVMSKQNPAPPPDPNAPPKQSQIATNVDPVNPKSPSTKSTKVSQPINLSPEKQKKQTQVKIDDKAQGNDATQYAPSAKPAPKKEPAKLAPKHVQNSNNNQVFLKKHNDVYRSIKNKIKNVPEQDALTVIKTLDDLKSVEIV